jgi:hypothetical protein
MFDADLPWDEADEGYAAMRWRVGPSQCSIQCFLRAWCVLYIWNKQDYETRAVTTSPLAVRAWMY